MGSRLVGALREIVGREAVIAAPDQCLVYECDMLVYYKGAPDVVVLPSTTAEVAAVVRLCLAAGVPVVPRGAGTGHGRAGGGHDRQGWGPGRHNLLEPEIAGQLLTRKLDRIAETGAEVVVSGNPGCLLQLRMGLAERGLPVRAHHPVELLAWSVENGPPPMPRS